MNRSEHDQDSASMLERLINLNAEHEWTTDELAESLRELGIDPEQLLRQVKERTDTYINQDRSHDQQEGENNEQDTIQPGESPLGLLCEITGLSSPEVAEELEVTVAFMLDLEQQSNVIPFVWPRETAKRAALKFPGVNEQRVLRAYEQQHQVAKAASRSGDYSKTRMTVEKILKRSEMSATAQQFWRSLAEQEQS